MPLDGIKNIVLVLSGKGGVGKSSITLQLALALTLQGKSVGILDVDLTGPSIPRLVGLEDAKITQAPGGWVPVSVHDGIPSASDTTTTGTDNNHNDDGGVTRGPLRCMSLGFLLRSRGDAVIWRGPKKTAMVRQFLTDVLWGETDYLLVDTPPGTSDEHIALAEQLVTLASTSTSTSTGGDAGAGAGVGGSVRPRLLGAVVVTTPQAVATADVRKEINFCVKTRIPVLGVVENMSGYACPCCGEVSNVFSVGGGEVMAGEMGVRFLGRVPIDAAFGEVVEGNNRDGGDEGEGAEGEKELLVDRYKRKCWSLPIFEGFARVVVEEAEGGGV
ncbi:cytosolic Fe-S cluster assembly factor cfd1 [Emmonsiellopsis sp. PD_5]|nr:cytosolic Fe-S cluster assembly factor cfd1 [Emmonsiellopsis sp. PD_5]